MYRMSRLQVGVHAHDRNSSVSTIVLDNNVTDALDTWHAGKEVVKSMKKITGGAAKWHGIRYIVHSNTEQHVLSVTS